MFEEFLKEELVKLPYLNNKYFFSLVIFLFALGGAKLLLILFEKYLEKIAQKTKTEVDDLIFEKTKKPLFYLILVWGLKIALRNLGLNGWIDKIISSLMALVFIFILMRTTNIIISVWGKAFAKKTKSRVDDVLLPLFHKITKVAFIIIIFIWVLDIWEVDITPYLAGAGIVGLVLGFALQDSLKNILGGITLILDKTFEIGDKIKLESGELGEVLDIGLRSTKLRTYDHEVIYIPNGYLANCRIQNYTRPTAKIRVSVDFGVKYGSEVKEVKKVVLATIKKIEGVLRDPPPQVYFLEMGDFALKFKAYFWLANWKEAYGKKIEATEKIYEALNKAKIEIPFPTQTIYIKN